MEQLKALRSAIPVSTALFARHRFAQRSTCSPQTSTASKEVIPVFREIRIAAAHVALRSTSAADQRAMANGQSGS